MLDKGWVIIGFTWERSSPFFILGHEDRYDLEPGDAKGPDGRIYKTTV